MHTFKRITRGAPKRVRLQWGPAFQNARQEHGTYAGRIVRGQKRYGVHKLIRRGVPVDFTGLVSSDTITRDFKMPPRHTQDIPVGRALRYRMRARYGIL